MTATTPSTQRSLGEQPTPFVGLSSINGASSKIDNQSIGELAVCGSPGPPPKQRSKKRGKKSQTYLARGLRWIVEHQIALSVSLLTTLAAVHYNFPSLRQTTEKFFSLCYLNPRTGRYGIGWDDRYFVALWVVVFTGIRVAFMDYVAAPLARIAKIKSGKDQVRFNEQAWIFLCYVISWSAGVYVMYGSEYWMNLRGMWTNWPDREVDPLMKYYYLIQIGFWLQQIMVLNIEEHRKDHWQMFTHHIVTSSLLFGSYAYYYTRVGNTILALMDTVDYVLALAKMLRYMGLQFACDCAFGVFIVSWFVTRHILYPMICWSIYADIPRQILHGCYYGSNENLVGPVDLPNRFAYLLEPLINPGGLVCTTKSMVNSFLVLLLFLQAILLVWFGQIARLAYKVLSGGNADDPRSDDEEVEEEDVIPVEKMAQTVNGGLAYSPEAMLEEEVGVEQMHFRSKPITRSKAGGRTTSVQLPVKKELLNRVGCDTKTTN